MYINIIVVSCATFTSVKRLEDLYAKNKTLVKSIKWSENGRFGLQSFPPR